MPEIKTRHDAERMILSAAINDRRCIPAIFGLVQQQHFTNPVHRALFQVIVDLYAESLSVNHNHLIVRLDQKVTNRDVDVPTGNDIARLIYELEECACTKADLRPAAQVMRNPKNA